MYYILASHGEYAVACKQSCEMIVGEIEQFKAVSFTADMTKDALEGKYEEIFNKFSVEECAGIITDVKGGTPYNVAISVKSKYPHLVIITGLSMGLLIPMVTGEKLENAIVQAKNNIEVDGVECKKPETKQMMSGNHKPLENGIINLRLDERLIHGQVATYWTRTLEATRIMVIGDSIVKDEITQCALKAAVPTGIKLSILTVENAAKRINEGNYVGQRVFVIVNSIDTIQRLLDLGVDIKSINIGNMGMKEGRKQIAKSVYCTAEELNALKSIDGSKAEIYLQMVPNDEKKTLKSCAC